ncbi:MAG: EVE domain-containing protein [Solimonas sp.]
MTYWLMKSEPDCFSIDDLASRPKQTEKWDGVRNYQVRNMFRDQMKAGDEAFFYHSSCEVPGVVGVMKIASNAYPDPTQFDPKADHYDPKSTQEDPRWLLVDVKFERKLRGTITLAELRKHEKQLDGLLLLAPGSRLSVTPVKPAHWNYILKLEPKA